MTAIIEAAARALFSAACPHKWDLRPELHEKYRIMACAVTPLIRAAALEEAARVVEGEPFCSTSEWLNNQIAARIRALKKQP
jgi:hypothetical protein